MRTRLGQRERCLRERSGLIGRRADRDAEPALFDRQLPDVGVLHDSHDLADPLRATFVDAREFALVGRRTPPNRAQQALRILAEQADQQQLFLARRHPFGLRAQLAERRHDVVLRLRIVGQLDRALDRRVDRLGRLTEEAGDKRTEFVDDREVPARGQNVEQRL